jgi:hypothetical protein
VAPRTVVGPGPVRQQRLVGDADGRQPDNRPKVQGQTRASRMVAARGVDQQDVGRHGERAHRRLKQGPLAQREQSGRVGGVRLADHLGVRERAASAQHRGRRPGPVAADAGARLAARKAHEARTDGEWRRGPPGRRLDSGQRTLSISELAGRSRPHDAIVAATRT